VRERVAAGDAAVIAIRPDDLRAVPAGNGGLVATVGASEFRGREFVGFARTADGIDLSFHAGERLRAGEAVHLGAAPERVLVFSGGAP
jgi:putative spermidine/putrescine transport system ATP-binding protein